MGAKYSPNIPAKSLNKEGSCFDYISKNNPVMSIKKLKADIFDGSQMSELMRDPHFLA